MGRTLADLKTEAERRLAQKNLLGALKVYRLVLEAVPHDFALRFDIADIFANAGQPRPAAAIYQSIAMYDIKAGNPLRALVALKILEHLKVNTGPAMEALIRTYAKGSPVLGRGIRPAPVDYDVPVRDDIDLDYPMEPREVADGLAKMAAYIDNIEKYPPVVPPIAILSTLEVEPFAQLCLLLRLRRLTDGQRIIAEGEVGESLFFVARGEVKVTKKKADGTGELSLARLGAGSIFGEMALISQEPRGASVIADGAVDVFELTRKELELLSARVPNVAGAMARFTRDRMIANLMATNPVFAPFDEASRKQLLARFVGHEVPRGTIFIEQGKPGSGLYLILQGQAEVLTWNGSEYICVATLGPGDVCGEFSLVHDEPATATLRTKTPATLLFLAKELFFPLVEAVPELFAHFARLANQRRADTENKLEEDRLLSGAGIEAVDDDDDIEDVDADDIVMV